MKKSNKLTHKLVSSALTVVFGLGIASPYVYLNAAENADKTKVEHKATELPLVEGEVRRVYKDTGKITIKHHDIPNLDMSAMTMVFKAKQANLLDEVKAGDKIKFSADMVNGELVLTKLEVVK